jgi:transposase
METIKKVVRLGIDLGKNWFCLFGVDEGGNRRVRKRLARKQLLAYLANMEPCLIGLEASGGSHNWAREITKLGHEVRLMSPQFVKPYVKSNKNDYNDAEAICEAVDRPGMRFVTIKTVEQQDVQALHRIRQSLIKARTAQANQIRGLLGEYGIVIPQGIASVRRRIPEVLEDAENGLTDRFRGWLCELYEQLRMFDERIADCNREILQLFRADEACQRIGAVEGMGPQTATAVVSAFGQAREFENGRQLSASLGLVPRQRTTGGKPRLLGISKRGDRHIRTLLIHGARSVVRRAESKTDTRSLWIQRLVTERGKNRAAVALANKNARIIWALLARGDVYRPAASGTGDR